MTAQGRSCAIVAIESTAAWRSMLAALATWSARNATARARRLASSRRMASTRLKPVGRSVGIPPPFLEDRWESRRRYRRLPPSSLLEVIRSKAIGVPRRATWSVPTSDRPLNADEERPGLLAPIAPICGLADGQSGASYAYLPESLRSICLWGKAKGGGSRTGPPIFRVCFGFSRPLATIAKLSPASLLRPLRQNPKSGRGGMPATCRRRGGGENPHGVLRSPRGERG